MRLPFVLPGLLVLCAAALPAGAQQPPGTPGVVTQGSQDTMIGGKPAARVGDGTSAGGPLVEGSSNVFINGKPAAIVGGRTGCGGVTVGGASNVFINGKPAAQSGSLTTGCAK
jgi:uncharacterized Zn-binding protein involved in type VI secretion